MSAEMHTPQIVEGIMNRVVHEIGRLVWNCIQVRWGSEWDAPFVPLECGAVSVIITQMDTGDKLMEVAAFGHRVGTWLDSKRAFYHAHIPDGWSDREFVDWARSVFEELDRLQENWHDAFLDSYGARGGVVPTGIRLIASP